MTRQIPDYVGEHFATHPANRCGARKAITCKDGTIYSVQASELAYSSPRDNVGPWTAFEVWMRRPGNKNWHTRQPEGWVSRGTINRRIHRHGGAAE